MEWTRTSCPAPLPIPDKARAKERAGVADALQFEEGLPLQDAWFEFQQWERKLLLSPSTEIDPNRTSSAGAS